MKATWLKALVAFGAFFQIVHQARAQPLFGGVKSIEVTVANADLVFIAKIIDLRAEEEIDPNLVSNATIEIERALKVPLGHSHDKLSVSLPQPRSMLVAWRDHAHRLLVTIDLDAPGNSDVIDLAEGKVEAFSADLTLVRDPEAVIKIASETVQRIPAAVRRLHTFRVLAPPDVASTTQWAKYSGLLITVPVDDLLEKRAHDYLKSDNYSLRHDGVMALQYFKSDDNIALLRSLLNDPGWAHLEHAEYNDGIEVRYFGVRADAFQILTFWDVQVDQPVVQEEVEKLGSVTLKDPTFRKSRR